MGGGNRGHFLGIFRGDGVLPGEYRVIGSGREGGEGLGRRNRQSLVEGSVRSS